jgi:hypothetical protein
VRCYIIAPHLLWAKAWAEPRFRSGELDIQQTFYTTHQMGLFGLHGDDVTVVLVNPVMCEREKWEAVKFAMVLGRAGHVRLRGASTEPLARFTERMRRSLRHVPFEVPS